MKTFFEPLNLKGPPPHRRTFIASTVDPLGINDGALDVAKAAPDWGYYKIATKHDAMLTAPRELAAVFMSLDG